MASSKMSSSMRSVTTTTHSLKRARWRITRPFVAGMVTGLLSTSKSVMGVVRSLW